MIPLTSGQFFYFIKMESVIKKLSNNWMPIGGLAVNRNSENKIVG